MKKDSKAPPPGDQLLVYHTQDGELKIDVRFEGETAWLTQQQMADLFQTTKQNVSLHIQNVFSEGELPQDSVVKESLTTAADGKNYATKFYNLDVIISVGYRVKSHRGTQFRMWATQRLREYLVKGFTMDDERLKNPPGKGHVDYFDELLERIRDIRSSERRVYLRVRDILALASDYSPSEPETQVFFQTVQNKMHFAATGKTAPELIVERADASRSNMGLTSWRGDVVRKGDVTVARNYLGEEEINELNRIVVMFLDFAEDQARRRKQIFLNDWRTRLDEFLKFNDRRVLPDSGQVSRESADLKATEEYERFAARRREQIEDDALRELGAMVKKIPQARKPKKPRKP
jgi:hypothetical protein